MRGSGIAAAVTALPLLAFAAGLGRAAHYADGPPPAHTGGFGEQTCRTCHFDNPLNDSSGALRLDGLPERYKPGETYRLVVMLSRAGMERAGFQMSVRYAEGESAGRQAGAVAAIDDRVAVISSAASISYIQQTEAGSALAAPDSARWMIEWRAPGGGGPVVFHLAGNAANGDHSEFGDHIYTRELAVRARTGH